MPPQMFGPISDSLKILNPIIPLVVIDVMNDLAGHQRPYIRFEYMPVKRHAFTVHADPNVRCGPVTPSPVRTLFQ